MSFSLPCVLPFLVCAIGHTSPSQWETDVPPHCAPSLLNPIFSSNRVLSEKALRPG